MKKFFDFDFSHFRGDLMGGLTAGIVALPLALAFGVSSGLGPSAGLYGAIFISFFAALFGGTNTQISGPTAPMTAVSMVFIGSIIATNDGDVTKALPIILMVFFLSGLIQIGLGFLGRNDHTCRKNNTSRYFKRIPNLRRRRSFRGNWCNKGATQSYKEYKLGRILTRPWDHFYYLWLQTNYDRYS